MEGYAALLNSAKLASRRVMTSIKLAPVPHSGQLNITTSTLPILLEESNEKCILYLPKLTGPAVGTCTIRSWLAHMLPSSAVRVGTLPSDRTLEVGLLHVDTASSRGVTSEQCPVADEPFATSTPNGE